MRNSLGTSPLSLSRKSSTVRLRSEVAALQLRGRRGSLSGEIGRPTMRRVDSTLRKFQVSRNSGQAPQPTTANKQAPEKQIKIPTVDDESNLRAQRLRVLSKISVFAALSQTRLEKVLDSMREVTFEDEEVIIAQGDYSSTFYVIEEGLVDITRRFVAENKMEKPHTVAQRGPLEYFGEFGLLFAKRLVFPSKVLRKEEYKRIDHLNFQNGNIYNTLRRSANCIARGKVKCLALEREDFDKLLLSVQQLMHARAVVKQSGYFDVSPIFSQLSKLQQQHTIEMLKPVAFKKGQTIYKKGDDDKIFYFIVSGSVEFLGLQDDPGQQQKGKEADQVAIEGGPLVEELVLRCSASEGFGEDIFMGAKMRTATAIAITDVLCLYLHLRDFQTFMGKTEKEYNKAIYGGMKKKKTSASLKSKTKRTKTMVMDDFTQSLQGKMSRYLKKTMSTLSMLDLGDLVDEVEDEDEEVSTSTQLGAAVKVLGAVKKFRTHLQRKQAYHSLYRNLFRDVHNNPDLVSTVSVLEFDIDWNDEDAGLSAMRRGFFAILEKEPTSRTKAEVVTLSLLMRGCGFVERFQRSWGRNSLLELIRQLQVRSFEAGQTVYKQGQEGSEAFILISGSVKLVTGSSSAARWRERATLNCKDSFGELALVSKTSRTATAYATKHCDLAVVPRAGFERVIRGSQRASSRDSGSDRISFLRGINIFKEYDESRLTRLASNLQPHTFPSGHVILEAGEQSEAIYFVESGEIRVLAVEPKTRVSNAMAMGGDTARNGQSYHHYHHHHRQGCRRGTALKPPNLEAKTQGGAKTKAQEDSVISNAELATERERKVKGRRRSSHYSSKGGRRASTKGGRNVSGGLVGKGGASSNNSDSMQRMRNGISQQGIPGNNSSRGVLRSDAPGLSTLGRGSYFGESGLLDTIELYTLVAHTPTRVLILAPEQYKRVNASCMEIIAADREGKNSWYASRKKDIQTSKKALARHHHHRRHTPNQHQHEHQRGQHFNSAWATGGEGRLESTHGPKDIHDASTPASSSQLPSPPTMMTRNNSQTAIFRGRSPLAVARTYREILAIEEGVELTGSFNAAHLTRLRHVGEADNDAAVDDPEPKTSDPETPRIRPEEDADEQEEGPLSPERLIREAIHEIAKVSIELEMWKSPRSVMQKGHGTVLSRERKKRAIEKPAARANEPKRKAEAAKRARSRAAARKVRRALKRVKAFSLLENGVQRVENNARVIGDNVDEGRMYGIIYSPRRPRAGNVAGHEGFANFVG